jgi:hypothetical protein
LNSRTDQPGVVQVIDERVLPWADVTDEDTFWERSAWSWWKVDLRSGQATLDPELPASAPYMTSYEVDGHRYVYRQSGDGGSRLYELSPTGAHSPAFSSIGSIRGVARLR